VSASKNQLDSAERYLRKFRKEYAHIHEWYVKADNEIRKIENKQVSTNTKEETDWIRVNFTIKKIIYICLFFRQHEMILKNLKQILKQ